MSEMFDKVTSMAKEAAAEHQDKIDEGIDKVEEFADDKTGGKYTDQISSAGDKLADGIQSFAGSDKEERTQQ
jgi:hypothetical protein